MASPEAMARKNIVSTLTSAWGAGLVYLDLSVGRASAERESPLETGQARWRE
jgi:hypothetical protein